MRSVFGKAAALAAATMVAGSAIVACSAGTEGAKRGETLGSVGLQFRAGPGINIPAVQMVVTQLDLASTPADDADVVAMTRNIPSPDNGSDFNFAVSLPPGSYSVKLTADTPANSPHPVHCEANATFSVTADITNQVGLQLYCDDVIHNGVQKYDVEVVSDVCPLEVDYASASPTNVRMGTEVATLSGSAHDDVGGTWAYKWTAAPANAGTFADSTQANTTFNCGIAADPVVLTLTATRPADSDGLGCSDSISVWVTCASALCGNGEVNGPSETCDDGNNIDNDACPNDCNVFCGDGVVEGNEGCEDPVGGDDPFCTNCQRVPHCGDGEVNVLGEECDDANGNETDGCRACKLPKCGDGIHNSFDPTSEQCDDGNTNNGDDCRNDCTTPPMAGRCGDGIPLNKADMSDLCDPPTSGICASDCRPFTNAACAACETGNAACAPLVGACDLLTGTAKDQCNAVTECMRRTNCGEYQNTDCYCGSNEDPGACVEESITPHGACLAVIKTALNASTTSQVLSRYVNRSFPGGVALARLTCDRANCAGGVSVGELSSAQCFAATTPVLP